MNKSIKGRRTSSEILTSVRYAPKSETAPATRTGVLLRLLEERTRNKKVLASPERKFFVRYDAWTNPQIRRFLDDAGNREKLSPLAQRFYLTEMPKIEFDIRLCEVLATILSLATLERRDALLDGRTPSDEPTLSAAQIAWIRTKAFPAPPAKGKEFARAIEALADYQERIFEVFYPAKSPGRGKPKLPSQDLDEVFGGFAAGRYHFVRAVRNAQQAANGARGGPDLLNAEPDSWLFTAFAEFSWHAARVYKPRAAYWLWMAQLFAALDEVYCSIYGPVIGPRTSTSYLRVNRRRDAQLSDQRIAELVQSYRSRFTDLESLGRKMALNAASMLADA
jgi:hypothetical protein